MGRLGAWYLALPRQTVMHNLDLLLTVFHDRLQLVEITRPWQVNRQILRHPPRVLHYMPKIIRLHPIQVENLIIPIPGPTPGRAQEHSSKRNRRLLELRNQREEVAADEADLFGNAVDAGVVARTRYGDGIEVDRDDLRDLWG